MPMGFRGPSCCLLKKEKAGTHLVGFVLDLGPDGWKGNRGGGRAQLYHLLWRAACHRPLGGLCPSSLMTYGASRGLSLVTGQFTGWRASIWGLGPEWPPGREGDCGLSGAGTAFLRSWPPTN